MFLSTAQLALVERLHDEGELDLLLVNIATTAALTTRGVVTVKYSKRVGKPTTVDLTTVGTAIAKNIRLYHEPPAYADVLAKNRDHKHS